MSSTFAGLKRQGAVFLAVLCGVAAQEPPHSIPLFSPGPNAAWQSDTAEGLEPAPMGPRPVGVDPAIFGKDNPYDMDTAFPVLDTANPNLQPWVVEPLKAQNARVLAGQPLQPRSSGCWPHGFRRTCDTTGRHSSSKVPAKC